MAAAAAGMPPKADAKARAAPKAEAKPPPAFEPLTEEELSFCWKSLVDGGQLKAAKLQQFMLDITGESMSRMQARDLISYMDIQGDGNVGQEDFRHFLSIGNLEATNPKDFMWTSKPKRGLDRPATDEDKRGIDGQASTLLMPARASGEISGRPSGHPRPSVDGSGNAGLASRTTSPPQTLHEHPQKAPEPKPPPGKRRGPPARGVRAAAAAAASALAEGDAAGHDAAAEKPKIIATEIDEKVRAHIESSITKYEQESWLKFLKWEEGFKEQLFKQCTSDFGNGMTMSEYHKMLVKWHKMARWSMPSDLRAADSFGALQYILGREQRAKAEGARADASAIGEASGAGGGDAEATGVQDLPRDARLSYDLWVDILNGKYRPDEHITSKGAH